MCNTEELAQKESKKQGSMQPRAMPQLQRGEEDEEEGEAKPDS